LTKSGHNTNVLNLLSGQKTPLKMSFNNHQLVNSSDKTNPMIVIDMFALRMVIWWQTPFLKHPNRISENQLHHSAFAGATGLGIVTWVTDEQTYGVCQRKSKRNEIATRWNRYSLVNIQKTMENHHPIMGKSTISMVIFNSKLLNQLPEGHLQVSYDARLFVIEMRPAHVTAIDSGRRFFAFDVLLGLC
jgi:hypothetical protein